jgi:fatty acid desaturase
MATQQATAARVAAGPAADWPTIGLAAGIYLAYGLLTWYYDALPWWVIMPLAGAIICTWGSLQHEVIHGHPTPWQRVNTALVGVPLQLVEPFGRYRQTHLAHPASDLTDPNVDPESHYVSPEAWAKAGPLRRRVLRANRTLAARMTIGPLRGTLGMWSVEARAFGTDARVRRRWFVHVAAVTAVVVILRSAGLPLWMYLLGFVFGGASLTALRSFVEHSAHDPEPRSAVVDSNWFFGLLFLNNNLHYTHHAMPGATWYRLPQLTRDLDSGALVADGAGHYRGYLEIAKRHMFRPFCQPVNPLLDTIEA